MKQTEFKTKKMEPRNTQPQTSEEMVIFAKNCTYNKIVQ